MIDLFSFKGKLARKGYIQVSIGILILSFLSTLSSYISESAGVIVIFYIILLAIFLAATVKRLRDIGSSPIWTLLYAVPFANVVLFLFLLIRPSKVQP